jgi:hypothetical protein
MNEKMEARAVALVMNKEVEFHHTDGNTHYFIGQGHSGREDTQYEITAEILPTNEIVWSCDCHYAQFNDDCKHTLACNMLMKKMIGTPKELRVVYNMRIVNDE